MTKEEIAKFDAEKAAAEKPEEKPTAADAIKNISDDDVDAFFAKKAAEEDAAARLPEKASATHAEVLQAAKDSGHLIVTSVKAPETKAPDGKTIVPPAAAAPATPDRLPPRATAEKPAPTPEETDKRFAPSAYKVGDRVVIHHQEGSMAKEHDRSGHGRHGVVVADKSTVFRKTTLDYGRSASPTTYEKSEYYHVKTDQGAEHPLVSKSDLIPETGAAPEAIPDPIHNGESVNPAQLLFSVKYDAETAQKKRAAASRARKQSIKDSFRMSAERAENDSALQQAAFDAWAKKYPEEAAKYQEKTAQRLPAPASATAPAGDAGIRIVEQMHTKRGHTVFIATMDKRVTPETFAQMASTARTLGGKWDKGWKPTNSPAGFMFNNRPDADRFAVRWGASKEAAAPAAGGTIEDSENAIKAILAKAAGGVKYAPDKPIRLPARSSAIRYAADQSPVDALYDQIKPHLLNIYQKITASGGGVPEFMQREYDLLGKQGGVYLKRFLADLRAGAIDTGTAEAHTTAAGGGQANETDRTRILVGTPGLAGGERPEEVGATSAGGTTAGTSGPGNARGLERGGRGGRHRGGSGRVQTGGSADDATTGGAGQQGATVGQGEESSGAVRAPGGRGVRGAVGQVEPRNFVITPTTELAPSGSLAKIAANIAAIKVLKKLEALNLYATPAEQDTLSHFSGWGQVSQVFDDAKGEAMEKGTGGRDPVWEKHYGRAYSAIKELMTPEERKAAARSTLNAHYTSPEIIGKMWGMAQRLGFAGGRILEPAAGIGHFLGLMPDGLQANTESVAVEMDHLSGRILAKLYPLAKTYTAPFENTDIPENSIDLAITNVPFAKGGPDTQGRYPDLNLHNFFIAKMLDTVKPGGLVITITSAHTMESQALQREYLASRGELVAAIRLPSDAFKANAGTEVTTDILIFRKPDGEARQVNKEAAWRDVVPAKTAKGEDTSINEYYAAHPEMLLGEIGFGKLYNNTEKALLPFKDKSLDGLLRDAMARLPENVLGANQTANIDYGAVGPVDMAGEREHTLTLRDGKLMFVENGKLVPASSLFKRMDAAVVAKRSKDYIGLRDHYLSHISLMQSEEATPEQITKSIAKLNRIYDAYVKEHGNLHSQKSRIFSPDNFYDSLTSMEKPVRRVDPETGLSEQAYEKMAIFDRRVMRPVEVPEKAEDAKDAIRISLGFRGELNIPYIAKLLGVTNEQAEQHLYDSDLTFHDPESGLWQLREKYLSGNVRAKLRRAQTAAKEDARLEKNVKALETVQPKPATPASMHAKLGATWIPAEYIQRFATDALDGKFTVSYNENTDRWDVFGGAGRYDRIGNFSTERRTTSDLLTSVLNMSPIAVHDTIRVGDSERTVLNQAQTAAAQAAAKRMGVAFKNWIPAHPEDAQKLADVFNEVVNSYVEMKVDGSHMVLPGSSDAVQLRPRQKDGIWRVITTGRAMLAHSVGSGKTYVLIGSAMELRRLGLAQKPLVLVHNATLSQFAASFKSMYPASNVLVATKRDLEMANRRRFMGRIVAGNWDAVVMPHSSFGLIPHDPAEEAAYNEELIADLVEAINEVRAAEGKKGETVKRLEAQKKKLDDRLTALQAARANHTKNDALYFQELGFDALLVDEAHGFKKPPFVTKIGRMVGLDTQASQKASNLMLAIRHIRKKTGGRNIVFATGTPITNTMGEAYHMLSFLAPDVLRAHHADTFDRFIGTFGQVGTVTEMDAAGRFKQKVGLEGFVNGDQLTAMIRSVFDVVSPDDMKTMFDEWNATHPDDQIKFPKIIGGKPEVRDLERTPGMDAISRKIAAALDKFAHLDGPQKKEYSYIPVLTYTLARTAALDVRMVDPNAKDEPGSKVNQCVKDVLAKYKLTSDKKGAQIIFCDAQRPASLTALNEFLSDQGLANIEVDSADKDTSAADEFAEPLMLYNDMRDKFVKGGIPREEIALITENDTDSKREKLFEEVNAGVVRVLIGGTDKIGVGVNIQKRAYGAHLLDIPWRPDQTEQRIGRVVRQDNMWPEVSIVVYGMKGTLDAAIVSKNLRKSIAIHQALSGRLGNEFEDPHSDQIMSWQEQAALFSGNPLALRRLDLDNKVRTLLLEREAWEQSKDRIRWDLRGAMANKENYENSLASMRKYIAPLEAALTEPITLRIGVQDVTGDKEIAEAIDAVMKGVNEAVFKGLADNTISGKYDMSYKKWFATLPDNLERTTFKGPHFSITMKVEATRDTKTSPWKGAVGTNIDFIPASDPTQRISLDKFHGFKGETALAHLREVPEGTRSAIVEQEALLAEDEKKIPVIMADLEKPWIDEDALQKAQAELAAVTAEMYGSGPADEAEKGLFDDDAIKGKAPLLTRLQSALDRVQAKIEDLRQQRLLIENTEGFRHPYGRNKKGWEPEWTEEDRQYRDRILDVPQSGPRVAQNETEGQRLLFLDHELEALETRERTLKNRVDAVQDLRIEGATERPAQFKQAPYGKTPSPKPGSAVSYAPDKTPHLPQMVNGVMVKGNAEFIKTGNYNEADIDAWIKDHAASFTPDSTGRANAADIQRAIGRIGRDLYPELSQAESTARVVRDWKFATTGEFRTAQAICDSHGITAVAVQGMPKTVAAAMSGKFVFLNQKATNLSSSLVHEIGHVLSERGNPAVRSLIEAMDKKLLPHWVNAYLANPVYAETLIARAHFESGEDLQTPKFWDKVSELVAEEVAMEFLGGRDLVDSFGWNATNLRAVAIHEILSSKAKSALPAKWSGSKLAAKMPPAALSTGPPTYTPHEGLREPGVRYARKLRSSARSPLACPNLHPRRWAWNARNACAAAAWRRPRTSGRTWLPSSRPCSRQRRQGSRSAPARSFTVWPKRATTAFGKPPPP